MNIDEMPAGPDQLAMKGDIMIKRTERGWAGHFDSAQRCRFRRNTLLELGDIKIVISTVGLMEGPSKERKFDAVGPDRYFETMAFEAKWDGRYWDANISEQISFESPWSISEIDADDKANDMHEKVVEELAKKMAHSRALGHNTKSRPRLTTAILSSLPSALQGK